MFEEPIMGFNKKQKELIDKFYSIVHDKYPDYTNEDIMQDENTKRLYHWTVRALKKL